MSHIDPRALRRSFDAAASTYDRHAAIQREVADRLLSRLEYIPLQPQRILDLGAGTGYCARQLERRYRSARISLLDVAPSMLMEARRQRGWFSKQQFVCGNAEQLPIAEGVIDVVISSLTFQWCEDLPAVLKECRRVLRPGGLLLFSSLGPDTLKELRTAFLALDELPHVNRFVDMHVVGDAMMSAGFGNPVLEREDLIAHYADLLTLMRDLKGIGARNLDRERSRELSGKRWLARLREAYEPFRVEGLLPATYELVFGHGWAPLKTGTNLPIGTYPLQPRPRR